MIIHWILLILVGISCTIGVIVSMIVVFILVLIASGSYEIPEIIEDDD